MKQNLFLRYKSNVRPSDFSDYSQRMFGWSFILVLTFLVIGLYFFWPGLFEMKEAYAPESAIRDNLAVFLEARNRCQDVLRAHAEGEKVLAEDLIQALETIHPAGSDSPRIYLWRTSGEFVLDWGGWPEGWNRTNPPWKNYKPGVFVSREKGVAHLILFEPIPTTDLYLVVVNPFLPPLTKEKETTP